MAPLTAATRRFSVAGVSTLLAIAAVLVAIGSAILLLPLTSNFALDFCVALVFGLSGGGVLVFTLLMMLRPARTDLPVDYHLPPVPPITLERDAVTLAWRWPLSARMQGLAIAAVGVLVCAAGVIGVISAVGNGFGDSTSILSGSTLHYLIGCIVALLGLLVFALAWSDVFNRSWYVEATHEGLRQRTGKRGETLAWAEIESVIARMSGGRITAFEARHAGTDTAIEWPPIARAPAHARGIAISGEELAALVVARSGQTLTIAADE